MKQQTILLFANSSWNLYHFRLGLIEAFLKEGFRVVCVAGDTTYEEALLQKGVKLYTLPLESKGKNPLKELHLLYGLYKLYTHLQPNIVLHFTIKPNIYGTFIASLLQIPSIVNISGLGSAFLSSRLLAWWVGKLYGVALKGASRLFFQNAEDRDIFIAHQLVSPQRAFLIAGSGVDTTFFSPRPSKHPSKKVRFLFIGRLLKDKGVLEYYEVAKALKGVAEFAILGGLYEGNPSAISQEVLALWQEEGVVDYLGECDDIRPIVAQYDVVVLPSYREGLSRVLLESASMEKPLVATNVAGCKEVVKEGVNGFLCEAKQSDSLLEAIEKMRKLSPKEREAMGKRGRERVVANYQESRVIDAYLSHIHTILFNEAKSNRKGRSRG